MNCKHAPKTTGTRKTKSAYRLRGGTSDANRLAISILEVLAGMRTPQEAATALAISLPRYYQLETRAVEGLVAACEPKPLGKQPSVEGQVARLQRQLQQAQRECARQQALVRLSQRTLGLAAAPSQAPDAKKKPPRDAKGRRQRRPAARALKAAQVLRDKTVDNSATADLQPSANETTRPDNVPSADQAAG